MGNGASFSANRRHDGGVVADKIKLVQHFRDIEKQMLTVPGLHDEAIADMIVEKVKIFIDESGKTAVGEDDLKEDEVRLSSQPETPASMSKDSSKTSIRSTEENFMDSRFIPGWLHPDEANQLFRHLEAVGEKERPRTSINSSSTKYPLWSIYYGLKRDKDGAKALDRWGSYHESWLRVQDPTPEIEDCCRKIRSYFNLPDEAVNSVVVNYYFDGDSTYIPAHRDTTACLDDDSSIFCLSLGASRDFLLVDNADSGKYVRDDMTITKNWRVSNGDMFSLGPKTNEAYCHCVPLESGLHKMRISVIFRSISKSFIAFDTDEKKVEYASGNVRTFRGECISTKGYNDPGTREHISDLIAKRELRKLAKKMVDGQILRQKNLLLEGGDEYMKKYFLGSGEHVLYSR